MAYGIIITKSAEKEFQALTKPEQRAIDARIQELAKDPRPPGAAKIRGFQDIYRIRAGDYRIVYRIQDDELIVLIIRIGHRRDVYRHMKF